MEVFMRGYVVIDVSKDIKQKIISLRNEVLLWKNKPKEEVITFESTPWWYSGYKYTCHIPDHLDDYLYDNVISDRYYYFDITDKGRCLGDLYHLITAGNPVYLGEDLARIYNQIHLDK
jgi:hypothetical protein